MLVGFGAAVGVDGTAGRVGVGGATVGADVGAGVTVGAAAVPMPSTPQPVSRHTAAQDGVQSACVEVQRVLVGDDEQPPLEADVGQCARKLR